MKFNFEILLSPVLVSFIYRLKSFLQNGHVYYTKITFMRLVSSIYNKWIDNLFHNMLVIYFMMSYRQYKSKHKWRCRNNSTQHFLTHWLHNDWFDQSLAVQSTSIAKQSTNIMTQVFIRNFLNVYDFNVFLWTREVQMFGYLTDYF